MVELALVAPDLCVLLDMASKFGAAVGRIELQLPTISGNSLHLIQRIGGLDPEEKASLEMFLRAVSETSAPSDLRRLAG